MTLILFFFEPKKQIFLSIERETTISTLRSNNTLPHISKVASGVLMALESCQIYGLTCFDRKSTHFGGREREKEREAVRVCGRERESWSE